MLSLVFHYSAVSRLYFENHLFVNRLSGAGSVMGFSGSDSAVDVGTLSDIGSRIQRLGWYYSSGCFHCKHRRRTNVFILIRYTRMYVYIVQKKKKTNGRLVKIGRPAARSSVHSATKAVPDPVVPPSHFLSAVRVL